MIDVEDLIALIRNYNPRTNADLIRDAYEYGRRMHEGQFRHSGEPYFTHPVAVAAIATARIAIGNKPLRTLPSRSSRSENGLST